MNVLIVFAYANITVYDFFCGLINVELFILSGDCPLIVQFAANDARILSEAAGIVHPYANGIDINCGCPQR